MKKVATGEDKKGMSEREGDFLDNDNQSFGKRRQAVTL